MCIRDRFGTTLILGSSLFISGCGNNNNTTNDSQTNTITMWRPFAEEEFFDTIISSYESDNSNIKVNYKELPFDNYELQSIDALAAQNGPDIWNIRNDWINKHLNKLLPFPDGYFKADKDDKRTDLEIFKQTFPEFVVNDLVVNNKIYGFPLSVDTLVMYYNSELTEQGIDAYNAWAAENNQPGLSGLPWTWEDIQKITPFLTKKDENGNITQSAIALGTGNNTNRASDILYLLMLQNGVQMVSPDNLTATFNLNTATATGASTNPGLSALNFYTSFSNPNSPNYTWNSSLPDSIQAFYQGKVAMMIGYGYFADTLKQKAPDFNYDITKVPQISKLGVPTNYANYWVETVTKSSKNNKSVWYLLKKYSNSEASNSFAEFKHESPSFVSSDDKTSDDPKLSQPLTAKTFNKGKSPERFDAIIVDMINKSASGSDHQKAIDEAATKITNVFRE
jgi:ABC-type glycerol-3-phosphate transport system substrate-binding protein